MTGGWTVTLTDQRVVIIGGSSGMDWLPPALPGSTPPVTRWLSGR